MVDGWRFRTIRIADGLGFQLDDRWTAISLIVVVVDDAVVVLDAVRRRDRLFFDALGEVVGKAAAVFLEAVVSTPCYAVVFEAVNNEKIRLSGN